MIRRILKYSWIIVFALFLIQGSLHFWRLYPNMQYSIWSDRDLWRASELFPSFQFFGPELTAGGRTPGGLYYYLLYLMQRISPDPQGIFVIFLLSYLGALGFLSYTLYRFVGPVAAIVVTALSIGLPYVQENLNQIYNPALAISFGLIAYGLFLRMIYAGKTNLFAWIVLTICMASQIHLSFLALFPAFVCASWTSGLRIKRKYWGLSALAASLAYGPTLIYDAWLGFPHFSEWFTSGMPSYMAIRIEKSPFAILKSVLQLNKVSSLKDVLSNFVFWAFLLSFLLHISRRLSRSPVLKNLHCEDHDRAFTALFVITVIGLLLTFPFCRQYSARYCLFLIPAVIIAVAIFLQLVWQSTSKAQSVLSLGIHFVCLVPALWSLYRQLPLLRAAPPPSKSIIGSYSAYRSILNHLKETHQFDRLSLETNILLAERDSMGQWHSQTGSHGGASYLVRNIVKAPETHSPPRCALVLAHHGRFDLKNSDLKNVTETLPIPILLSDLKKLSELSEISYFSYRLPDGNCFRNITNPYVLVANEPMLISLEKRLGHEGCLDVGQSTDGSVRRFLIRRDSKGVYKKTLYLMLELISRNDRVSASVYSNQLRGYDGINDFSITGLDLEFLNDKATPLYSLSVVDGLFGQPGALLSPWHSPSLFLPSGNYSLELTLKDKHIQRIFFSQDGKPQFVTFPDKLHCSLGSLALGK